MNKLGVVMMLAVLSAASILVAGQYSEAVLNLSPDAYYRFNNASAALGDVLVNQGTAGAAINGTWGVPTVPGTVTLPTAGQTVLNPSTHVITYTGGPLALGMDADNKCAGFIGPYDGQNTIGLGNGPASLAVFNAPVMTWSLWFRLPTDYASSERLMVNVPDGPNTLKLLIEGQMLVISTGSGNYAAGQVAQDQNGSYLYGNWHNIVVVKTGSNAITDFQLYEDGSSLLWGDVFNPGDPGAGYSNNAAGGQAVIGSRHQDGGNYGWGAFGFKDPVTGLPDGQIDEVACWTRALTETDIAAMFAAAINDPKGHGYVNGNCNLDSVIDGVDLATLAQNWDPLGGTQRRWAQGDFNGDGVIDGVDLAALAQGWAPTGITGGAVPEPATLSLLVLGGLAALRRRK